MYWEYDADTGEFTIHCVFPYHNPFDTGELRQVKQAVDHMDVTTHDLSLHGFSVDPSEGADLSDGSTHLHSEEEYEN